ncbi:hypothetical protein PMAYCL1PPCAC_13444 [Pristionchus mayeri]|uniref:Uncharacterized protein n=1 Tax=Pristionchus mayeri TaxID=1317129 RepID=A0AAN5CGK5_9BILA|nr:hypothetical protein PMAYCL1PPCAC_13444 [Pristionchus mayeri]
MATRRERLMLLHRDHRILSSARSTQSDREHNKIIRRFLKLKVHTWRARRLVAKIVHLKAITTDRLEAFYARLVEKQFKRYRRDPEGTSFQTEVEFHVNDQLVKDLWRGLMGRRESRKKANKKAKNLRFFGELCRIKSHNSALRHKVQHCAFRLIYIQRMDHDDLAMVISVLKKGKMHLAQLCGANSGLLEWLEEKSRLLPWRSSRGVIDRATESGIQQSIRASECIFNQTCLTCGEHSTM